uniref:NADH dehydrogenase subunit 6 n=1 Tax=Spadella cephaloptera TaxID=52888 RepID=Q5VB11_9BILA|nr:NADH dehydrogenase subunit 6 [Spadella cephaloptera]AAT08482.1 NADH dehydrogenase subunit 6 [Spadella cephaloptera]
MIFFYLTITSVLHFIFLSNPFSLGISFFLALICLSALMGSISTFIGLILFLVYVGGTMVLVMYCFMLTPLQLMSFCPCTLVPFFWAGFFLYSGKKMISWPILSSSISELYFHSDMIFMVGVVLFLVMLAVVEVVDYSKGALRWDV